MTAHCIANFLVGPLTCSEMVSYECYERIAAQELTFNPREPLTQWRNVSASSEASEAIAMESPRHFYYEVGIHTGMT